MRNAVEISGSPKSFVFVLLILILTLVPFSPMVQSQTSRSYISKTGKMSTFYKLAVYSPNEETAYQNVMPLNFTIDWTYDILMDWIPNAYYAYSIDNGAFVGVVSNQSSNDKFASNCAFVYNPSFSYLIDTSNLSSGQHDVVIKASFYAGLVLCLDDSSRPFSFRVQNPTSPITPSNTSNPTIPTTPSSTPNPTPSQSLTPPQTPTQSPALSQTPSASPPPSAIGQHRQSPEPGSTQTLSSQYVALAVAAVVVAGVAAAYMLRKRGKIGIKPAP